MHEIDFGVYTFSAMAICIPDYTRKFEIGSRNFFHPCCIIWCGIFFRINTPLLDFQRCRSFLILPVLMLGKNILCQMLLARPGRNVKLEIQSQNAWIMCKKWQLPDLCVCTSFCPLLAVNNFPLYFFPFFHFSLCESVNSPFELNATRSLWVVKNESKDEQFIFSLRWPAKIKGNSFKWLEKITLPVVLCQCQGHFVP